MSKADKQKKAFDNLCAVCEHIAGIEKEDVTPEKILGSAPATMAVDDPQRENYIGMDQIDMMKFMLYTEQEFNKEIEDTNFVPRKDAVVADLWENRTVKELMEYCADNIVDD